MKEETKIIYCSDILTEEPIHIFLSQAGASYKGGFFRFIKNKYGI